MFVSVEKIQYGPGGFPPVIIYSHYQTVTKNMHMNIGNGPVGLKKSYCTFLQKGCQHVMTVKDFQQSFILFILFVVVKAYSLTV